MPPTNNNPSSAAASSMAHAMATAMQHGNNLYAMDIESAYLQTPTQQAGDHASEGEDEDDGMPPETVRAAPRVNPRTVESVFGRCVATVGQQRFFIHYLYSSTRCL